MAEVSISSSSFLDALRHVSKEGSSGSSSLKEQSELPTGARPIPDLDEGWKEPRPGPRLEEMRARARAFAPVFRRDGAVRAVRTANLAHFPYPVAFGLWQAAPNRAKYLTMRNRLNVIEYEDFAGNIRILLANPTEHDLSARAPFFEQARRELAPFVRPEHLRRIPGPLAKLRKLGVDPAKVDFLTFDHLHVQDVRRALIGENGSPPLYPNAKLLVNRRELETLANLHPLQRPWWIPEALDGVPREKIVILEESAWLGRGLMLVWTPGHTLGNHSIVFNAPGRGVFAVSENGICPDSYLPEASKLRSLREYAKRYGAEVVMNANSVESIFSQYTSMIVEKELVCRGDAGGEVPNIFNSSPFVRSPLAWGIGPSFAIRPIQAGEMTRSLFAR